MNIKKQIFIGFFVLVSFLIFSQSAALDSSSNNTKSKSAAMSPEQLVKIDTSLKFVHASFAAATYAQFIALDIIGGMLLYYNFTGNTANSTYDTLKYAHIGLSISGITTFGTMVTLAFTKLGLKAKYGFTLKTKHVAAAVVAVSFYVLELTSMIISAVYFTNKYENSQWVGLAHGITCGATTLSMSVSLITIFL